MNSAGIVSGLSYSARRQLQQTFFNATSWCNILSFFPNEIEEIIFDYMKKNLNENILKTFKKYRHHITCNCRYDGSCEGEYILNNKIFRNISRVYDPNNKISKLHYYQKHTEQNLMGYKRGLILSRVYSETKNKDEKIFILMMMGLCHSGMVDSGAMLPFGTIETKTATYLPHIRGLFPNYEPDKQGCMDLNFRMYQIAKNKYKEDADNFKEQYEKKNPKWKKHIEEKKAKHIKHFNIKDDDSEVKFCGDYHKKPKYKVKNIPLCKGKSLECEEIVDMWEKMNSDCREIIHIDYNYIKDKKELYNFFKKHDYPSV